MGNSGFISSQNGSGQVEKERKNNYCSDPSCSTQNRKFQKKKAKKFKKLKNTIQASLQAKIGQDRSRNKGKKISHSDPYYLIQNTKFQKEGQKNSKN